MSRAKLIIFDCDGVLVDSERISVRVGRQVLAELGWHLTEREFAERFVGCSAEHFHREVSTGLGRDLEEGWDEPYAPRYREAFEAYLEPVQGVPEVLRVLGTHGVAFCVASNSDHRHIEHVLHIAGLSEQVAGRVFSASDVSRGKPEPDLFLHAAQTMGVDPHHCAVVEDSPFGVRAAVAAGMDCYAYAGGMTPAHKLSGLGAVLFDEMADLPGALGLCPSPPPRSDIPSEVHR